MFAYTAEPGSKSEQALDLLGLVSHDGPTRAHPHHRPSLTRGSRRPASPRDRDLLVRFEKHLNAHGMAPSSRGKKAAQHAHLERLIRRRDGTTLIFATA
jgi:hypothetical protein